MNERIKQLAEQAKSYMTDKVSYLSRVHNRNLSSEESADIFEQEFAELIIKDCLYQVRKDMGPQDEYHFIYNMTLNQAANSIEELLLEDEKEEDEQCPCGHDGGTSCGAANCLLIHPEPERYSLITHVAVKTNDKIWSLPAPNRHHHVLREIFASGVPRYYDTEEQGFLDDRGNFWGRENAFILATQNGQLIRGADGYQGNKLFSEDLW